MQEGLRRRNGRLVLWLVITLLDRSRPRRGGGIKAGVLVIVLEEEL
jgi:hypothetical protein